jgi:hypothetical protein
MSKITPVTFVLLCQEEELELELAIVPGIMLRKEIEFLRMNDSDRVNGWTMIIDLQQCTK